MQDHIQVRGDVKITITHESGTKEVRHIRNLVMRVGKTILAKRLANDGSYASSYVNKISMGTSNSAASDTQTDLAGTKATPAAAITVTYPAYNSVMFSSALLGTEGNGNTYQELGLFAADNKMFSRTVIAAIVKSSSYKIAVDWLLTFQ
jgi:hypothetical protein